MITLAFRDGTLRKFFVAIPTTTVLWITTRSFVFPLHQCSHPDNSTHGEYSTNVFGRLALEAIESHPVEDEDSPLFLYLPVSLRDSGSRSRA